MTKKQYIALDVTIRLCGLVIMYVAYKSYKDQQKINNIVKQVNKVNL